MPKVTAQPYDVERVRKDFPILSRQVHGKPLVYLDSAASSQRPIQVIEAVDRYEKQSHSNVHRGVHALSQEATEAFEGARDRTRRFINARSTKEIIFTRGTTESINLVAQSYARSKLGKGDEILITALEHHANIVPWQLVCEQIGCTLKVAPIDKRGELIWDQFEALLSTAHENRGRRARIERARHDPADQAHHRCRSPCRRNCRRRRAHRQSRTTRVDVQALGADFYAFSAHKLLRPHGHRGALRPRSAARLHAPVAGRRRHDPHGHVRKEHVQRSAVEVRGGHAEHVRRGRPCRCDGLRRSASDWTR